MLRKHLAGGVEVREVCMVSHASVEHVCWVTSLPKCDARILGRLQTVEPAEHVAVCVLEKMHLCAYPWKLGR